MSYPYTPPAGGLPTSTTYPYGAYHPNAYAQTQGAYSYQAPTYQAGVTGYGWTYPYGYLHALPTTSTTAQTAAVAVQTSTAAAAAVSNATTGTALGTIIQPRPTTLTSYTPTYAARDSAQTTTGTGGTRGSKKQANFKGLFAKELKSLMFGFGDDRNPSNDTVNVMEEILVEYIMDVCQAAGTQSKKSRLSIEDLRRALSRPADAKKLARMEELLFMQEDIKRARAQFLDESQHPNAF